eukprot:scaffold71918_cov40-Prasinocladus_malaysianus.AAC.1
MRQARHPAARPPPPPGLSSPTTMNRRRKRTTVGFWSKSTASDSGRGAAGAAGAAAAAAAAAGAAGGAGAGGGGGSTIDMLEQMMRVAAVRQQLCTYALDPEMQKSLYPYLPEPMRNPETMEWMLSQPEYRAQMEQMLQQ